MDRIEIEVGQEYLTSKGKKVKVLAQEHDGDFVGLCDGMGCYVRMTWTPPKVFSWSMQLDCGDIVKRIATA